MLKDLTNRPPSISSPLFTLWHLQGTVQVAIERVIRTGLEAEHKLWLGPPSRWISLMINRARSCLIHLTSNIALTPCLSSPQLKAFLQFFMPVNTMAANNPLALAAELDRIAPFKVL